MTGPKSSIYQVSSMAWSCLAPLLLVVPCLQPGHREDIRGVKERRGQEEKEGIIFVFAPGDSCSVSPLMTINKYFFLPLESQGSTLPPCKSSQSSASGSEYTPLASARHWAHIGCTYRKNRPWGEPLGRDTAKRVDIMTFRL